LENAGELANTAFRAVGAEFRAKIVDLSDFSENTTCCAKSCNKIAYMVKFGREHRGATPVFSCKGFYDCKAASVIRKRKKIKLI
jgi:hypothetical protein